MTCVGDGRKMTMEHWWNVTDRGKLKYVLRKTPSEYHVNA